MSGMARYARQTIADIPYHIINRGNNHQVIFFRKDG
jgi:REP element-mobilizing transposase RayT